MTADRTSPIDTIAVVGAGVMGRGITQAAAAAGYKARITDTSSNAVGAARQRIQSALDRGASRGTQTAESAAAALARIECCDTLENAAQGADLIIEAVPEDLALKQTLFQRLDELVADDVIFATNTSSLSITRIADVTRHPARVVGMHFFNPVHAMKLVEVVTHSRLQPAIVDIVRGVAEQLGKTAIVVRDSPGFASSRLGVLLGLEAMRLLEEGVASAEDIDTAMELGYGHPMGPLRVSDVVGLDVRLQIAEYLYRELGEQKFEPPRILRDKVACGEVGKKAGKGFYEW